MWNRDIEQDDEEDRLNGEKMMEEMKKRGLTNTEIYEEMKRDFIKHHKVDLSIDKLIDEWEIDNEVM